MSLLMAAKVQSVGQESFFLAGGGACTADEQGFPNPIYGHPGWPC